MGARFQFYEVVRVVSNKERLLEVAGLSGAVLGMSENEFGEWGYAVHIFDKKEVWDVMETDLLTTGEFKKRDDFYDGTSTRVIVDPETGEGSLADEGDQ